MAGAHGFIGPHLVRALLDAGADVQLIVRPGSGGRPLPGMGARGLAVAEVDVRNADETTRAIGRLKPARIVNLVRPRQDRLAEIRDDAPTASNLLDAAREAGSERLVQLGSGLEYGVQASRITENTPLRPVTEFGAAKAEATRLMIEAGSSPGLATVVLRPFMVYGPGEPEWRLIPSAARAALQREALPITAPGCRRDWVFVDDVVSAIVASLDGRADGEVVNLASGRDSSNEEVVGLVADAVGRPLQTLPGAFPARPWDVRAQRVSTEKAKQKLGWSADVALEQGIARTVASLGERSVDREAVLR